MRSFANAQMTVIIAKIILKTCCHTLGLGEYDINELDSKFI